MTRRFFITEAVYEKILGTLRNEYDILLGKSFTVDPISKRRLENLPIYRATHLYTNMPLP